MGDRVRDSMLAGMGAVGAGVMLMLVLLILLLFFLFNLGSDIALFLDRRATLLFLVLFFGEVTSSANGSWHRSRAVHGFGRSNCRASSALVL